MENRDIEVSSDAVIDNLKDSGCSKDTIEEYMKYEKCECKKMQLCILAKHRKKLLDNIHREQKKLDCLDFLIYKLKGDKHDK